MKFIEYAEKYLDDNWEYNRLFSIAIGRIGKLKRKNPELVKKMILDKLERAKKEYGEPVKGKFNIEKEIDEELVDLIFGWPLVKSYLKED